MDAPPAPVPPALDALLAERAWVRSLARTLVLDRNDADDLEQDAWVAALERPPRDVASPRGWLATVLRRGVARGRRTDARVARRERAASRPESVMATSDLVAHAEQHRKVVGLVLDLDEPYRSTLLARFFEGLPPRDIAARAGEPVKTVASRLARGLGQIRERLDREHQGERRAWVAALAPLAGIDPAIGGAPALRSPTSGASTTAITGGLLMGAKGKVVVLAGLALLLGAGAWWLLRDDAGGGGAPAVGPELADVPEHRAPTLAPGAGGRAPAREPSMDDARPAARGAGAAADEEKGFGVVIGERVDGKMRSVGVATFAGRAPTGGGFGGTTSTDGHGFVPLAGGGPPVELWAWAPGFALRHATVSTLPESGELEIPLERGRLVEIQFVDAASGTPLSVDAVRPRYGDGEPARRVVVVPAESAQVHAVKDMVRRVVLPAEAWQWDGHLEFVDGAARLSASLPADGAMILVPRPGDEPYLATVRDVGGERLVATVPIRATVPTVHVRCVAFEDGTPVPQAILRAWAEAGDDALFVAGTVVVADARGEADLPLPGTPPPGMRSPTWWATSPGRSSIVGSFALVSAKGATVTIELAKTATIRGKAYLRSGALASGKQVIVGNKGNYQSAVVGADGTFELTDVVVRPQRHAPTSVKLMLIEDVETLVMGFETVRVEAGATAEVQIGRPASAGGFGRIRGRVTAGGMPLQGVLVAAGSETAGRAMSSTDAEGRYVLDGLSPGEMPFMMAIGDPGVSDDAGLQTDKAARVDANEETILDFDLPGGALRVKVVDDKTGKPVAGAAVWIAPESREVEKDRFPGFRFRPGWSALADENGIVIARALPLNAPLQVEGGTKDRGMKGGTKGVLSGDAANPPEVVLRIK